MKNKIILFLWLALAPCLMAEVKNRDRPSRGDWDFQLEKVWEIDKAGDNVFGHPFSLAVSDEGRLYVFDSKNGVNYIIDADGKFVKAFARGGQGPGEVLGQEKIHLVKDWLIVPGMNGIHYFTKDGEYVKTVKQGKGQRDPRIFISEESFISSPMTAVFLPEGKAQIIRKNLASEEETVIASFTLNQTGVARDDLQVVDIIVIGLSPIMTLGLHENRLFWGLSDAYTIHVSDLEGNDIGAFSINRKKQKISNSFKSDYFKNFDLPAEMMPQIVKSFPNVLTFFHRIEVHNGLIYVFIPGLDPDMGRAKLKQIDIFSMDGKYLYRAHLDFGEERIHLFSPLNNFVIKDGYAFAVCERKDDTVVILKNRIRLPGF
jgi:hypothetical protein